jgi:hypothetical protein
MQMPGGHLLTPVQTLVATLIKRVPSGIFGFFAGGTRRYKMQMPGGHLLTPVQTLVATLIKRVPSGVPAKRPLLSTKTREFFLMLTSPSAAGTVVKRAFCFRLKKS